jgi:exosome complex exonuclease RRP6
MFVSVDPIAPKSFKETPFTWVADSATFAAMLDKLRGAREIAIDLEYHSYRSFYGFVCLMQLSTRDEDWVVDTLVLREELEELNEVFTDPEVVKVCVSALKLSQQ